MTTPPERFSAQDVNWELGTAPCPDYRDLDITELAINALEESQTYRLITQQAAHLVHAQDVQLKQLRMRNQRLADQLRERHGRKRNAKRGTSR